MKIARRRPPRTRRWAVVAVAVAMLAGHPIGSAAAGEVVRVKDAKSSAPLLLYQVVTADGTGYWLVQGIVAAERSAACLPQFRKITASIARRDGVYYGASESRKDGQAAGR